MKLTKKSYSSTQSQSNSTAIFDEANKLFIVAFCWGQPIDTKKYLTKISNLYLSQVRDSESTRAVPFDQNLNFHENRLKTTLTSVNNLIFKNYNKNEYMTGLEIFVGLQIGHAFYYSSTGQPSLLLNRSDSIKFLSYERDLSSEHSINESVLSPLPKDLFGTFNNKNININKVHCKKNDQLILLKRPQLPETISISGDVDTESLSEHLIDLNSDLPFWLATLFLD